MALLKIRQLTARYGQITALEDISLEVHAGEAVALLGANGAGKSSLLNSIMGFVRPVAGAIEFDGQPLVGVSIADRCRRGIGYAPEGRRIFPGMTVKENLEVASRAARAVTAALMEEVFGIFPILRTKEHSLGWQLSGGQQQMLAIGRALMTGPRLFLLDEPSLGLSPILTTEVLDRVRAIIARGTAVLLAEQNVARALAVANRAYVLQTGRIVEAGATGALRENPRIREAFLGG
ncbi:MAG TPA: ABC transporter ATP-binding protein [Gemmatimonadaceae bacterium]|nr:ABC transporter ATP-binding protein [Gemmatimonadaceae bacterium]